MSTANISNYILDRLPTSIVGFILSLFIVIPVCVFLMALCIGAILASFEGWPLFDGWLYVMDGLCGLAIPLTKEVPTTPGGYFIEHFSFIVELSIAGALIGIIAAHPCIDNLVRTCEGRQWNEADENI